MIFKIKQKVKIIKGIYKGRIGIIGILAGPDVPKRIGLRIPKAEDEQVPPYYPTWFSPDAIEME